MQTEPLQEYRSRLAARQAEVASYDDRDRLISLVRLAIAGAFAVAAWMWWRGTLPGWATLVPVIAFFALVVYHDGIFRLRERARRAVRFYEHGIARIENRWAGMGRFDFTYDSESHLYAADLDIFGKASLFELLCTARTHTGEDTLARWLCSAARRDEVLDRQKAVDELRANIDLREDLAILADDLRSAIRPRLTRWSSAPPVLEPGTLRHAAWILAVLNVAATIYYLAGGSFLPVLIVLPISILFARMQRDRVLSVLEGAEEPQRELKILGIALERLEREKFNSQRLAALRKALDTHGTSASAEIRRLLRLISIADSRRNQFFRPFSYFLMWATQAAYALEAWRRQNGPQVPRWLMAVGEFEALCSLAGYAYEHPADPFPEIAEGGPVLKADEVRHPLLPAAVCVPNSVHFDGDLRLLVVSGSNMSGKSTLLRTVGINVVLALAGAPVRARSLTVCPVNIGATLRIQDSLQAGTSRFYAEIQRLRQIMDLTAGPLPVLFLLDEILHGTNSHDRAIGAEAVVRGLLERGAMGLVTTHDLALARVAESLSPRAMNVHFEDHLENGRMTFDYRLRRGVVEKSNALELMRAVGLEV